jgi:hypothetical protein
LRKNIDERLWSNLNGASISCNSTVAGGARGSLHFGGSGVIDIIAYIVFFIVIGGCLWFLDSALKNERD